MTAQTHFASETVGLALEATGQTMFEYDPSTGDLAWADLSAARSVFGFEENVSAPGMSELLSMLGDEHLVQRERAVETARAEKSAYTIEYALGDEAEGPWVEERGTWLPHGGTDKLIAMVRRIDEQKRREKNLSYLASYDELTGQLNRMRFIEILEETMRGVKTGTRHDALFFAGIDDVGTINNDFGIDVADQVIVEVAQRIDRALGNGGIFGRVAGTKFGILVHEGSPDTVLKTARNIMNAMRESIVLTQAGGIGVSVCIGATYLTKESGSAAQALSCAEAAFDQARRQGASSFQLFREDTDLASQRRKNNEMSDVILRALNDRRIYLAYQPIVTDITSEVTKYECLIRMRDENGSEVPAPSFIPAAERLGLVHLLDRRVLELATKDLAQNPDIALNVNLSWETVRDPVWAEGYLSHLRANARVCDRLTIELTETQMVDAIESSREFVAAIKSFGCKFAIDDFGAGYTSFRNLKALDIDVLKIDGSFVSGVSTSRENQLFVRTLLDLARNFGMKTVAEWVDDENDAQLLKALGVDYLQGYYIGKPAPLPRAEGEEERLAV
ncbi:putative bifunctional diguanylate cyclase/phosphodiesterase [Parvularcula marina]|uniref:Bifunctional diguanylate cyclase/phosphodiesterase n=1 Tax=Parvularcula marina TaxID=2292771 RepID=A0A371RH67_9PROT|nr:bifunctional diguanylate cyclase/phosphodiesterase [Parvularcula marina]RFB04772.1 bifunctional diguanylate cyclase/phosphodiesterase [Parvularcula marina]